MSRQSYLCDISKLGSAFQSRDYSKIKNEIMSGEVFFSYFIEKENMKFGYHIHKNNPLTKIYGFEVDMVDFVFSEIETLHDKKQLDILNELLLHLKNELENKKAYYVFRVPAHIVDLIKAFNTNFKEAIFCGGIVSYISRDCHMREIDKSKVDVVYADEKYIEKNKEDMLEIAQHSFSEYQGQYHLAPATEVKAKDIYTNWLNDAFKSISDKKIIIAAEYNNDVVAFWTCEEDEDCIRAPLSGVSGKYSNIGVYKRMALEALNISAQRGKALITGTQFDNFAVQAAWTNIGQKPFFSYYNFHVDCRREKSET